MCPKRFREFCEWLELGPAGKAPSLSTSEPTIAERVLKKCKVEWDPSQRITQHERLMRSPDLMVSAFKSCGCRADEDEIVWLYQINVPRYFNHVAPLSIDSRAEQRLELKGQQTWRENAKLLVPEFRRLMEADPGKAIRVRIVLEG